MTPVSTTGAKLVLKFATGGKFATGVVERWCTLTCEYLREFSKKFETFMKKTKGKKSRDTVPLS